MSPPNVRVPKGREAPAPPSRGAGPGSLRFFFFFFFNVCFYADLHVNKLRVEFETGRRREEIQLTL